MGMQNKEQRILNCIKLCFLKYETSLTTYN